MIVFTEDTPAGLDELLAPYSPPHTHLVDRIRFWAREKSAMPAYAFHKDGETLSTVWNYPQLLTRVEAVAAELESRNLRGKRILLLYPPCIEFIEAFFGCQAMGAIPVPAFPPRKSRNGARIDLIAEDADAQLILTNQETATRMPHLVDETRSLKNIPIVASELIPDKRAADFSQHEIDPDDVGLLQYTSGSTGAPKGVVLTHRNLIENCKMITGAFQIFQCGSGVSWLPTYHDMGLVGGILNPLFIGRTSYLLPPLSFLAKPVRWLKVISDSKATISGGPNFAYQLCVDKITPEEMEGLDLSNWEVAFNGAEPIRPATLEAFNRKFESVGFRPESHYPCYGMAETTLLVTGGSKKQPPAIQAFDREKLDEYKAVVVSKDDPKARLMVGCGYPQPDEEIVIVNTQTMERLSDEHIGEIWIAGSSVGKGYWNKPDATREVFSATYDGCDQEFLRTGDLGFMHQGQVFVTGRLKDLIIIRGVNRYPQDIEATVEASSDRLQNSGTAAFAIDKDGEEKLVIVSEIERSREKNWSSVIEKIRREVMAEHDLPPDAVVMVRAGSIQKTSSGKIQRHACKKAFLNENLKTVDRWFSWEETPEPIEAAPESTKASREIELDRRVYDVVIEQIQAVGKERAKNLTAETNIVLDVGLDSLERLQIANGLEEVYGQRFPEETLQEIETVAEVVQAIMENFGADAAAAKVKLPTQTALRIDGEIPDEFCRFELSPEVRRFEAEKRRVDNSGIRNPFFSVHEGNIQDKTQIDGRELISFASYNYLGMNGDPEVSAASKAAIDEYGTSVSASRLVSGEKKIHRELEAKLQEVFHLNQTLVLTGGHSTNESVIGHLLSRGDLIIHDSLAHNSIIQGAFLSGATRRPFEHNNWDALDEALTEIRRDYRRVLIAIEGLYSMDGDFPDLQRFIEIRDKHKCMLYVDEAHSFTTLGKTGRGICEQCGVDPKQIDFVMGTISKGLGSFGGFISSNPRTIEYLKYTVPGFVFAGGLPAADVAAGLAAVKILEREPERVATLRSNSELFLSLAKAEGLDTGPSGGSPIVPVITGDSLKALRLSELMFEAGINAQPILHPAVEEDRARVRFFITSLHTEEQIRKTVGIAAKGWREINAS